MQLGICHGRLGSVDFAADQDESQVGMRFDGIDEGDDGPTVSAEDVGDVVVREEVADEFGGGEALED